MAAPPEHDPSEHDPSGLDRRALMLRAFALVGAAAGAGALQACGQRAAGPFFDDRRRALLDAVADTMIPATDTPGALAAEVPAFVDAMMRDWASRDSQGQFTAALDAVDDRARADHGMRFASLPAERRLQALAAHDAAVLFEEGNPYRRLKELILVGYYTSEIGATQELRYELVPGSWQADIPLNEGDRAWAF